MKHETTLAEVVAFAERDAEGFSAWFDRLPPEERRLIVRLMEEAEALAEAAHVAERATWN